MLRYTFFTVNFFSFLFLVFACTLLLLFLCPLCQCSFYKPVRAPESMAVIDNARSLKKEFSHSSKHREIHEQTDGIMSVYCLSTFFIMIFLSRSETLLSDIFINLLKKKALYAHLLALDSKQQIRIEEEGGDSPFWGLPVSRVADTWTSCQPELNRRIPRRCACPLFS